MSVDLHISERLRKLPVSRPADALKHLVVEAMQPITDEEDIVGAAPKALKNLLLLGGEFWIDTILPYVSGDIEECEIRRFARRWGIVPLTIVRMITAFTHGTQDDSPEEAATMQRALAAARNCFQNMWCIEPTGHAYFILAPHSLSVKIGYTGNECAQRLLQLQTGTPEPLLLLGYMPADSRYTELFLHEHFRETRIRGEWFQFDYAMAEFIRWACDKRAPDVTLERIPEFSKDKWNCDPWPKSFPRTNKEIESWLSQPSLY